VTRGEGDGKKRRNRVAWDEARGDREGEGRVGNTEWYSYFDLRGFEGLGTRLEGGKKKEGGGGKGSGRTGQGRMEYFVFFGGPKKGKKKSQERRRGREEKKKWRVGKCD